MNPAEIIARATEDGVLLALSPSCSISAKGVQSAIDRWLPVIRQSKAAIVLLLRPSADDWAAEDWQAFFDERAGIAEFDGGLPRSQAKARAYACCVAERLNRNFVGSPPGRCLGCGTGDHAHEPLIPFGIDPAARVWLHSRCWPAWHAGRKAEAVLDLAAMGITAPGELPNDFGKIGGA